jgi:hypothetical protein
MKIFVAMPVYDGKLPLQTAISLLQEQLLCGQNGHELVCCFLPSCSVPAAGRNQLVQSFMESDCDRLVFLDSDISFPQGALLKIAGLPVEFVGGCYRYKKENEDYPITWKKEGEELYANELGLLEVGMLPTGFLALSRSVFEKFQEKFPERHTTHHGRKQFCYFQMVFHAGQEWSEDTYFCKEWRDMGGKVYLDPEIPLSHWEQKYIPHESHIGNWLKKQSGIEVKQ